MTCREDAKVRASGRVRETAQSGEERRWRPSALEKFAQSLKNFEVPVLVCWRHVHLPALARAILGDDGIPESWPGDRFDITWSIRCAVEGWTFLQVPQLLLAGDRMDAID